VNRVIYLTVVSRFSLTSPALRKFWLAELLMCLGDAAQKNCHGRRLMLPHKHGRTPTSPRRIRSTADREIVGSEAA
jgi:hypothetical protein